MAPLKALQGNVSWAMCGFTSCRQDVLPLVGSERRRERTQSTYHDNSQAIIAIITPIMHGPAGYGGLFTPTMWNVRCTLVGTRLNRVHTTNEPRQSSLVSGPRPPRSGCFDPHPQVWFRFTKPDSSGVKTPPAVSLQSPENKYIQPIQRSQVFVTDLH